MVLKYTIRADGRFGTLINLLAEARMDDILVSPELLTIFAPTDDAFAALPASMCD